MAKNSRTDKAWYLVYTKPQKERIARENLERQGYEIYLPFLRKNIRRGRQFYARVEPLFPRYLFICLSDRTDDWGPIRSTTGVTHLVRFGSRAVSVPDDLIQVLREHEDESGVYDLPGREPAAGDRVRFIDGPLSGYEAIYQQKTSADRVIVLMDIAGKHSRLTIPDTEIELVDSS